jgi:hypothetical protein
MQNHENAEFATSGTAKADIEIMRSLRLAAVKRTAVQVTRQPMQRELHELGHDLPCQA